MLVLTHHPRCRFVQEAVPVVKKIVSEVLLSDEDKSIKPVNVGGVAGGDKYAWML